VITFFSSVVEPKVKRATMFSLPTIKTTKICANSIRINPPK